MRICWFVHDLLFPPMINEMRGRGRGGRWEVREEVINPIIWMCASAAQVHTCMHTYDLFLRDTRMKKSMNGFVILDFATWSLLFEMMLRL